MITASESSKIGNGAHLCFISENLAQILCYGDLLSKCIHVGKEHNLLLVVHFLAMLASIAHNFRT